MLFRSPCSAVQIARKQAIPQRFLEIILNQLKQAGLVEARRGRMGGYRLKANPEELTVGDILRVTGGELELVGCQGDGEDGRCPLWKQCVFFPLWDRAQRALSDVCDGTTIRQLVDQDRMLPPIGQGQCR